MAHTKDGRVHGTLVGTRRRSTLTLLTMLLTLTVTFPGLVSAYVDQSVPGRPASISCSQTEAGQLLLHVRLTGATGQSIDANFTLDTGLNNCCISTTMATRLGLKSEAATGEDGRPVIFQGAVARLVRVPSVVSGPLHLSNLGCVVLNAQALSSTSGQVVDGVLGSNLLSVYPALINLPSREVTFFGPGPVTAATLRAVGMADAPAIPLSDLDNNFTYACLVRVASAGKSIQRDLVLDIGSGETMITGSDARELGLSTLGKPTSSFTLLAGSVKMYNKMYKGKTTSVVLGNEKNDSQVPIQARDVTVAYPKGDLPDFLPPHLGRDVLGHFLMLMDFAEKKMYVKPLSILSTPALVPKITIGGK